MAVDSELAGLESAKRVKNSVLNSSSHSAWPVSTDCIFRSPSARFCRLLSSTRIEPVRGFYVLIEGAKP